jgi:hypothetical protein
LPGADAVLVRNQCAVVHQTQGPGDSGVCGAGGLPVRRGAGVGRGSFGRMITTS